MHEQTGRLHERIRALTMEYERLQLANRILRDELADARVCMGEQVAEIQRLKERLARADTLTDR